MRLNYSLLNLAGYAKVMSRRVVRSSEGEFLSTDEESEISWIENFLSQDKHRYFCYVDPHYIQDNFNLYDLKQRVHDFRGCIHTITSTQSESAFAAESLTNEDSKLLYGLVHARFILTANGLERMRQKFDNKDFGCCRNKACNNFPYLPIGEHAALGESNVHLYCGRCNSVYRGPRNSKAGQEDGSFWGPTFPHLFLMQYRNEYKALLSGQPIVHVPKVFGFKVHRPQSDASEQAAHMLRLISSNKRLMEENARLKRTLHRQTSEQAMSSTTVTSSGGEIDADLQRKSKVRKVAEM